MVVSLSARELRHTRQPRIDLLCPTFSLDSDPSPMAGSFLRNAVGGRRLASRCGAPVHFGSLPAKPAPAAFLRTVQGYPPPASCRNGSSSKGWLNCEIGSKGRNCLGSSGLE
jgi:hypothetical protein